MNLKQLSEKLGLSQTTVSRALGGYPEVKAATRERVHQAVLAYNYKPSRQATSLATGRSMAIGHVIPLSRNHAMVNPVFADFIAGASEVYAKAGYAMLVSVVSETDELRTYRDLSSKGTVDGVIVHGPVPQDTRIKVLHDLGLPFVVHGRAEPQAIKYSYVDINNYGAFTTATHMLLDLGHEHIGLLNGTKGVDYADQRERAYCQTLAAWGFTPSPDLITNNEMTEHAGYDGAKRLLSGANPPTAFLASSVVIALGVHRALAELGLKLGRDISVVCHDDVLSYIGNGGETPLFTGTRSSVRAARRRCAELLLDRIVSPTAPHTKEAWDVTLYMGQSTGPAPRHTTAQVTSAHDA